MKRYICIHGHFYQPPRENPWLEAIELQDSAYPYHDWNERITAECYGPNGTSRILDESGWIVKIMNNYSRISFNFGPTLLSWMEEYAPDAYRAIFEADKMSQERFSGHGSAMAQVYNHMIMPLANARDKFTQVFWGIRDFESRFGRKPEGMWLAETAVDIETLDIMAQLGIKFTILAPHQVMRFRKKGDAHWTHVHGGNFDPSMPYHVNLKDGRSIAIFFYDGPISRAIAFEGLLQKGEHLVNRLLGAFSNDRSWNQLVHIATDGETYGHHHRYGDMALAYALSKLETDKAAILTNYAEFLEKFPPTHEAEVVENSSWSCMHGVERWRSNCGCNMGGRPQWNQEWRRPFREAMDWLRDAVNVHYERRAGEFLKDPWMARNDYIEVLLDRAPDDVQAFVKKIAHREVSEAEKVTILKLLELQRQLMLMYTSCGWFFDEISGIEAVQVMQYAGRAIQLAQELFGQDFEGPYLERLAQAKSNVSYYQDGRAIYLKHVKEAVMDLKKVGAHYAISSLFENGLEDGKTYCYTIEYEDYKTFAAGKARMALGWIRVTSDVTEESERLTFGIIHLGDHNLSGGVCPYQGPEAYGAMIDEITAAFKKADFTRTIRIMDAHFGGSTYSLKSLFKDEQRKIVSSILENTLADAEAVLRQIYENNAPLMRFLADLSAPPPKALELSAEFTLNANLRHALESDEMDMDKVAALLNEAKEAHITLDGPGLAYALQKSFTRMIERVWTDTEDALLIENLDAMVALVKILPFEVNLWNVQNNYYELMERVYPEYRERVNSGDDGAQGWLKPFLALGKRLHVKVV